MAKCKALYVVKGMGPTDISKETGVANQTVRHWISKGQWMSEQKARLTRLENVAVARATDQNAAFLESMAAQSEDLAESGMEMARKHVASADDYAARNFQSATQGIKNVVDVYFRARGIDGKTTGSTLNIGSVYVNNVPIERALKPVVDLGKVQLPEGKA